MRFKCKRVSFSPNQASCLLFTPLFGELFQKLRNIPLAATTARECTRPSGNAIHIQTLLEQALNFAPGGAAARAHYIIRVGILHVHGEVFLLPGLSTGLIPDCPLGE